MSGDALVLAHGAFHGPWCWHPLIQRIEARGVRCVAVDLNRGGLEADCAALQSVVDWLREDGLRVHAMGHSLGCASVAGLEPGTIATLTLLAGSALGPGLPDASDIVAPGFLEALIPQPDGRAFLSRAHARQAFYHRCPPELADWALDRLRPTFVYGGDTSRPPVWPAVPTTYVACSDDRAVRSDYQRELAAALSFSATLDFDHSPMLGAPDTLAEIVLEALARAS